MSASLDELRAFTAVYEAGGFTAASKRLSLTTNAISLRVQKLEEGLGVRLFLRTTRSVSPTEEGRSFYGRVVRVLTELEDAESDLRPKSEGLFDSPFQRRSPRARSSSAFGPSSTHTRRSSFRRASPARR